MDADLEEEEGELYAAVEATLEKKGVLSLIRAQLRAAVFEAVIDANGVPETEVCRERLASTRDSDLGLEIIADFLTQMELKRTLCVYAPEAGLSTNFDEKRASELRTKLGLVDDAPVLLQLIAHHRPALQKPPPLAISAEDKDKADAGERRDFKPSYGASKPGQQTPLAPLSQTPLPLMTNDGTNDGTNDATSNAQPREAFPIDDVDEFEESVADESFDARDDSDASQGPSPASPPTPESWRASVSEMPPVPGVSEMPPVPGIIDEAVGPPPAPASSLPPSPSLSVVEAVKPPASPAKAAADDDYDDASEAALPLPAKAAAEDDDDASEAAEDGDYDDDEDFEDDFEVEDEIDDVRSNECHRNFQRPMPMPSRTSTCKTMTSRSSPTATTAATATARTTRRSTCPSRALLPGPSALNRARRRREATLPRSWTQTSSPGSNSRP
ncbi:hypothetical protein M885DRAFT_281869 [Pelagophyceae sp. CCMP2097]|nr:hypothetical protein M885DRAFT_281869 [Pelagophyceae sp. CCMP2097]